MNKIMRTKTYALTDFYLSAYLKAKGLKLLDVERNGRRATFIFEDRNDRKELIKSFYNNGMVQINAFKNAIQDLKAATFNL